MILAEQDDLILRTAILEDFHWIDEITVMCYTAIHESWVEMQSQSVYEVLQDPNATWQEMKNKQNHDLFDAHPECVWVLEKNSDIIGFVTFKIDLEKGFGLIENNGVLPQHAGQGLGKFMYRYVLDCFRKQGLKVAIVETGLDDPHIPARNAYEKVGFDRSAPIILYWQDLRKDNAGSHPE